MNESVPTSGRMDTVQNHAIPPPEQMLEELRRLYAEKLEIPLTIVTSDADLEADLGVDSLTQEELLDHALVGYGLAVYPEDVRATNYPTLIEIVELVQQLSRDGTLPRRHD